MLTTNRQHLFPVIGLVMSSALNFEPQPQANSPLQSEKIPGITEIIRPQRSEVSGVLWKEWKVEGAKVVIFHVRNHHLNDETSPDSKEAETYWKAQGEIYEILNQCSERANSYFIPKDDKKDQGTERCGIAGLYCDGPTDKYIDIYNLQLKEQQQRFGENKPTTVRELLAGAGEALKAQGAMAAFAIKYNLIFNAAENFELHEKAVAAVKRKSKDADDIIMRQREDLSLERIMSDFPNGEVCVINNFGADHYYWDNIAKWNKTHPDFKISLVEVSPHIVRELRDELPSGSK